MAGLLVMLAVGGLSILFGGSPAGAHARLVETTPVDDVVLESAPEQVELVFDERMQITPDAVRIIDPTGERVDVSATQLSDNGRRLTADVDGARRGTYTVAWRATSADAHTLTGSFVFHVDTRTGGITVEDANSTVVDVVGGVGRWLTFAGLTTAIGAAVLALLSSEDRIRSRLRLVLANGAALGAVGTFVVLVSQTADVSGRALLDAVSLVYGTGIDYRSGRLTAWRLGLLALAVVLALVPPVWRRARWLPLLPLVGAVFTLSLTGHPWTASARVIAVISDSLHLIAVGIWAGGLLALLVALPVVDDQGRLVKRFSQMALGLVVVVAVTGTVSGLYQVPDLEALTTTTYGQLLIGKVALFVALVVIGWVNRARVIPALDRAASLLVRNVRLEIALVAVVLALTAALVEQPPARVSVSRPSEQLVRTEDASMQVVVDPARVGDNTIHLYFYERDGQSPLAVDAVEVTAALGDIPPRKLTVFPAGPDHVTLYEASLSSPGTWTLVVTAVRAGVPMTFNVEVPVR